MSRSDHPAEYRATHGVTPNVFEGNRLTRKDRRDIALACVLGAAALVALTILAGKWLP